MLQVGRHTRLRPRCARGTRGLLVVIALAAIALATAPSAMAWKPYAHNYIGDQAYNDAIKDGWVTIGGRNYPLDPHLVTALRGHRAYFNAGVVGPDGFPDIAFGQSVIHPEHTGKWLSYILKAAWDAQAPDSRYSDEERKQILAFAYGFLTHAAGDMWGHTLINDFAGGIFPSVGEITTDRAKARIALRHIVAEGYAGSATPGWDRDTDTRQSV